MCFNLFPQSTPIVVRVIKWDCFVSTLVIYACFRTTLKKERGVLLKTRQNSLYAHDIASRSQHMSGRRSSKRIAVLQKGAESKNARPFESKLTTDVAMAKRSVEQVTRNRGLVSELLTFLPAEDVFRLQYLHRDWDHFTQVAISKMTHLELSVPDDKMVDQSSKDFFEHVFKTVASNGKIESIEFKYGYKWTPSLDLLWNCLLPYPKTLRRLSFEHCQDMGTVHLVGWLERVLEQMQEDKTKGSKTQAPPEPLVIICNGSSAWDHLAQSVWIHGAKWITVNDMVWNESPVKGLAGTLVAPACKWPECKNKHLQVPYQVQMCGCCKFIYCSPSSRALRHCPRDGDADTCYSCSESRCVNDQCELYEMQMCALCEHRFCEPCGGCDHCESCNSTRLCSDCQGHHYCTRCNMTICWICAEKNHTDVDYCNSCAGGLASPP